MMEFFDDDKDFDKDDFFNKEFDINFGPHFGDKNIRKSSKKTTTTTTTTDENSVKKLWSPQLLRRLTIKEEKR